jgi:hypothetical protein
VIFHVSFLLYRVWWRAVPPGGDVFKIKTVRFCFSGKNKKTNAITLFVSD